MTKATLQWFVVLVLMAAIAVNTYFVIVLTDSNQTHHQESGTKFQRIERDLEALRREP